MSSPSIGDTSKFWSSLIDLNRQADSLIERCQRAVEPTQPIGREIPFHGTIEALFEHLPTAAEAINTNSDAIAGNNIKRPVFTNGSSRVYVRELSFETAQVIESIERLPLNFTDTPANFRWNFFTSISQRWYATPRGCLAAAGGRPRTGNHRAFREPLIIEPMETLVFECELLSSLPGGTVVVTMILSGYREGV